MIESAEFTINAWDHAVDFVVEPPRPQDPVAALKASVSGGSPAGLRVPLVFTGISAGTIHLAVEVLDHEPEDIAPGWEDVLEVSLTLPEGRAYFNQPTGSDVHDIGSLDAGEAGSYRARLHANGRDPEYDLVVDTAGERHLVLFWKAPAADTLVLASESSAGKSWPGVRRDVAQPLTGPGARHERNAASHHYCAARLFRPSAHIGCAWGNFS